MLSENIKAIRKSKGLSQEELAAQMHVVRQTISKWEQGLSVPDSDLLVSLSDALETPVSTLLGETVMEPAPESLQEISEKLAALNLQLTKKKDAGRKALHWLLISLCPLLVTVFIALVQLNSPYLAWDYHDPQLAIAGTAFHALEWLFIRSSPLLLIGAMVGVFLTRKKA